MPENLIPIAIPVAVGIAAIGMILFFVRSISKKNVIRNIKEKEIDWKTYACPNCKKDMEKGYSMAGRGIIWRKISEKKPGLFPTIGSALKNTTSFNAPPALNLSWRCDSCNLIVLDYSKMVKIKTA